MARVAYENLREFTRQGEQVLFVGTKKQARDSIKKTAERCGMPYINQRWPGGLITNWTTVKKSTARMKKLETMEQENSFEKETRTKKEALGFRRALEKLRRTFGGIKDMQNLPENLFVIDPGKEIIAIREARKMGIKVFAVVDSNCSPEWIDFPIPGNDDAIRAVSLFLQTMGDAVLEGTKGIISGAEFRDDDVSMEDESITAEARYRGEYDESGEFILDEPLIKEGVAPSGKEMSPDKVKSTEKEDESKAPSFDEKEPEKKEGESKAPSFNEKEPEKKEGESKAPSFNEKEPQKKEGESKAPSFNEKEPEKKEGESKAPSFNEKEPEKKEGESKAPSFNEKEPEKKEGESKAPAFNEKEPEKKEGESKAPSFDEKEPEKKEGESKAPSFNEKEPEKKEDDSKASAMESIA